MVDLRANETVMASMGAMGVATPNAGVTAVGCDRGSASAPDAA